MQYKALDIIRLIGGEFSSVPTANLEMWIEIVRPMVSRKQYGKLYEQALALLVCHKLKMSGEGNNPLGELGVIGAGFSLGSVSEGGSSVSFGAGQSSNLAPDAELGLTAYGVQYLNLRRMVIVPIHVSGEQDLAGTTTTRRRRRQSSTIINQNPVTGADPEYEEYIEVPVASETELGVVRVKEGSGLKLDSDGTLSVDVEGLVSGSQSGGSSGGKLPGDLGDIDPMNPFPKN